MGDILPRAVAEAMADVPIDCENLFKNELKKEDTTHPPSHKKQTELSSIAHVVACKHITLEQMPEGHGQQQRLVADDADIGLSFFVCCV